MVLPWYLLYFVLFIMEGIISDVAIWSIFLRHTPEFKLQHEPRRGITCTPHQGSLNVGLTVEVSVWRYNHPTVGYSHVLRGGLVPHEYSNDLAVQRPQTTTLHREQWEWAVTVDLVSTSLQGCDLRRPLTVGKLGYREH